MGAPLRRNDKKNWNRNLEGHAHPDSGIEMFKKTTVFEYFFMKSLVIPYQSKIRDDKYTLPLKRKELSCADFGTRFWQSPVNALRRANVLWHRPAGKRFWLLRARPANLRKSVRLQFHRGANRTKHVQFKCRLPCLYQEIHVKVPGLERWRAYIQPHQWWMAVSAECKGAIL